MVGSRSTRHAQVWLWIAELGAVTGTPVSVGLLCDTAAVRLGVDGVTVAVDTVDGWPETRYATETLGQSLAELQVTVGEGPSADARKRGAPIFVDDLDTTSSQRRWPLFAPLAVEAGARALFTLPLVVGAVRVGVLALHRVRAGILLPTAVADALTFARLRARAFADRRPLAQLATDVVGRRVRFDPAEEN